MNKLFFSASLSLIALIILNLLWEIFYNPLHSEGSLMVIKSVILLIPLSGILKKIGIPINGQVCLYYFFLLKVLCGFIVKLEFLNLWLYIKSFSLLYFFYQLCFFVRSQGIYENINFK